MGGTDRASGTDRAVTPTTADLPGSLFYLDVVDLHATAVCCCQRGGELDLFGQLAPLPAVWLGALNLKRTHQRYRRKGKLILEGFG